MSFTAQYHGECASCGHELKDTECVYVDDECVHVSCPAEPVAAAVGDRSRVCGSCFIEHGTHQQECW